MVSTYIYKFYLQPLSRRYGKYPVKRHRHFYDEAKLLNTIESSADFFIHDSSSAITKWSPDVALYYACCTSTPQHAEDVEINRAEIRQGCAPANVFNSTHVENNTPSHITTRKSKVDDDTSGIDSWHIAFLRGFSRGSHVSYPIRRGGRIKIRSVIIGTSCDIPAEFYVRGPITIRWVIETHASIDRQPRYQELLCPSAGVSFDGVHVCRVSRPRPGKAGAACNTSDFRNLSAARSFSREEMCHREMSSCETIALHDVIHRYDIDCLMLWTRHLWKHFNPAAEACTVYAENLEGSILFSRNDTRRVTNCNYSEASDS